MKTFRIFLKNGLTADVIAAKIELRAWREGDPALVDSLWVMTNEAGLIVAWFLPEVVVGVHGELGM